MVKSFRIERLNESVKEILSELMLGQIKDPRVGLVTITAVQVAHDMTTAKVHFSVLGDEAQRKDTLKGLISARSFMRKTLARELKVRNAPELKFVYDDSLEKSLRIENALREAGIEPGAKPADGDANGDNKE